MFSFRNSEINNPLEMIEFKFDYPENALDKLKEVGGKDFKVDIKPYEGILKKERSKYLIQKENDIWYLRIY